MRKGMKLALEEEQIRIKSQYDHFDGYEIHLYGNERDHFDLAATIDKPIFTVHAPMSICDVNDIINNYQTEYFKKVFDLCKTYNAGLVMHAEYGIKEVLENKNTDSFCQFIRENRVTLHVENCYRYVGAIQGLELTRYLQNKIGRDLVFPLLDICHLIMSEMSYKFEEMAFFKTIDAYSSSNFKIHLNDCIGSGEHETGGIHGTNFYANKYLLWNILWKLKVMSLKNIHADLILEVDEVDYNYPTNAHILAKNVDKMWAELDKVSLF